MRVHLDNCCFNRPCVTMTDTEIKANGFRALVAALEDVQAEKFIALIQREPFDYTRWQQTLCPDKSVEEISEAAFRLVSSMRMDGEVLLPELTTVENCSQVDIVEGQV